MENSTDLNGVENAETAVHLKELGNQDFKEGHFDKAILHYSKAIGIHLKAHLICRNRVY